MFFGFFSCCAGPLGQTWQIGIPLATTSGQTARTREGIILGFLVPALERGLPVAHCWRHYGR